MGRRTPGRETLRENIPFLNAFLRKILFLASRQRFLMVLTCSWVSWRKNDTERSRNFFKNLLIQNMQNYVFCIQFSYSFSNAQDQSPRRFVTEPPNLLPVRTCRSSMVFVCIYVCPGPFLYKYVFLIEEYDMKFSM